MQLRTQQREFVEEGAQKYSLANDAFLYKKNIQILFCLCILCVKATAKILNNIFQRTYPNSDLFSPDDHLITEFPKAL